MGAYVLHVLVVVSILLSALRSSNTARLPLQQNTERSVLAGQYIVMLKEDLNDDADFQENRLKSEITRACRQRGIQGSVFTVSKTLGAVDDSNGNSKKPGRGKLLLLLTDMMPEALEALEQSHLVAAVFPDLPLQTQQDYEINLQTASTNFVWQRFLSKGVTSSNVSSSWTWNNCLMPGTRPVWIGQRCAADGLSIQWSAVYAAYTGNGSMVYSGTGAACILLPNSNAFWTTNRFGGCGAAPGFAPGLPIAVGRVAVTETNCISSGNLTQSITLNTPVVCGTGTATTLTYMGQACGPNGAWVRWTNATGPGGCTVSLSNSTTSIGTKFNNDIFGNCGVQPGNTSAIYKFLICPAATTSGSNGQVTYTGPVLGRVNLAPGDQPSIGVTRIEAVRPGAVVGSASTVPDVSTAAVQPVVIGIVDTGIDSTHPDINYVGGMNWATPSTTKPNDDQPGVDNHGHGTHVAGIAAARANNQGVVGVSPGTGVFALKVLNGDGQGTVANVLSAVKWVSTTGRSQNSIRVINISLASYLAIADANSTPARNTMAAVMQEASDLGVVISVAAGNYGSSLMDWVPASLPMVATVTAVDESGKAVASFSNFLDKADPNSIIKTTVLAAPGASIRSSVPFTNNDTGYKTLSGTSQASPHVAGVAANCILSGACNGTTGQQQIAIIMAAAQERYGFTLSPYGFTGDPANAPNAMRQYGYMVWSKW